MPAFTDELIVELVCSQINSSLLLHLVKESCNWREQFAMGNPVGCLSWNFSHVKLNTNPHDSGAPGPIGASCASVACGVLWEQSRGMDKFLSFEEAVNFDDAARARVGGSACTWPATLMHGDACWHKASHASQKELIESDVCKFLYCRAALSARRRSRAWRLCALSDRISDRVSDRVSDRQSKGILLSRTDSDVHICMHQPSRVR